MAASAVAKRVKPGTYISFDVGIRNLSLCVIDTTVVPKVSVRKWEVVDILVANNCKVKNAKIIPEDRLTKYMHSVLHQRFPIDWFQSIVVSPPRVLIETQIKRGGKNKTLAAAIMMYFLSIGITDVQMVSAKKKMDVIKHVVPYEVAAEYASGTRPPDGKKGDKVQDKRYRSNKRLAKKAAKSIVNDVPSMLVASGDDVPADLKTKFARGAGKCDDLADCMLQALFFSNMYTQWPEGKNPTDSVIDDNEPVQDDVCISEDDVEIIDISSSSDGESI